MTAHASVCCSLDDPDADQRDQDGALRRSKRSIASVAGVGAYLPDRIVSNAELAGLIDTSDDWIYTRTGIRQRHIAAPNQTVTDLAQSAATQALEHAGCVASDLDLIIVATATPQETAPSTACRLQCRLGAPGVAAMDLMAACSGFLYGVHIAAGLVRSGLHRRVLVVGVEILSRRLDWTDRASCVLFGDGAGAAVVSDAGRFDILSSHIEADGRHADVIRVECDPTGGHPHVRLRGGEVYRMAIPAMAGALGRATTLAGIDIESLRWIIPHQANSRILRQVGIAAGVPEQRIFDRVQTTANTSAASIPIALRMLLDEEELGPREHVGLVSFGAGTTAAAQVWRTPSPLTR